MSPMTSVSAIPGSAPVPVIQTTDLAKRYGRVVALAGLTMTVQAGEVFGFLGPNGAGKTTTVKLLLGLARPSGGRGSLLGRPLGDLEARRRVGYLPELFRYQPWLRAREVLALHADLIGLPAASRARTSDETLELVGLTERADAQVGGFSKGMQQRLGLGVALLGRPDLVVLDEPTSALDPLGRIDVRRILATARDRGSAVFLNSHLLGEVERVCDRVAIVNRGRVVAEGPLAEVLGRSVTRIRVDGLAGAAIDAVLGRRDGVTFDGRELAIPDLPEDAVPTIVAGLVVAGGRIHEVHSGRDSLEARFLALVGHAGAGDEAGPARSGAS